MPQPVAGRSHDAHEHRHAGRQYAEMVARLAVAEALAERQLDDRHPRDRGVIDAHEVLDRAYATALAEVEAEDTAQDRSPEAMRSLINAQQLA